MTWQAADLQVDAPAEAEQGVQESPPAPPPARQRKAKPDEKTRVQPKRQPPHAVVLHNDPVNGMDFVIGVLGKVFHYSRARAFMLMLRAHLGGRSIVWTGTLELAELKAEQVRACGPDPRKPAARELKVTIEPLPEG